MGRAEAFLGQGGVPNERVVFTDQHVCMAIAVQVHKLQVWIAHIAIETGRERAKGVPTFCVVVFVETGHRAIHHDQIWLSISGKVHELRTVS